MRVDFAKNNGLEKHGFITIILRSIVVPLLNSLPSSFIRRVMHRSSRDASTVIQTAGSTRALEVMYTRHNRRLFERGILEGIADVFWHHVVSQPKALRNRLRIIEDTLAEELSNLLRREQTQVMVLSVGGGSARALIHTISRFPVELRSRIKVINIDKSSDAINLSRDIAARSNLGDMFEWIVGDARDIKTFIQGYSADIVEMVGLLDYFSFERGVEIISQVYRCLKRGGLFIVANVIPNEEIKFVEKTGWPRMYYRQPGEVVDILRVSGFTQPPNLVLEPLKVHIVATVRK